MDKAIEIVMQLAEKYPIILMILGSLGSMVVAGTAYISLSPSKKDDAWLQKMEEHKVYGLVFRFFKRFSVIERKKDPKEPK